MNIESILKYQKEDEELFKIEQKIAKSAFKAKANELAALAKKAQVRSTELEAEADKMVSEISDIKEKFAQNKAKADELLKKDLEKLDAAELDKLALLKSKIMSNLNILEKMLQKSAENINRVLSEFNKTKKTYDDARAQYNARM